MKYRTDRKSGNELSILGYGCMRFPMNLGIIDKSKTEELILKAYNSGVNYFDTAYIYPGSEEVLGELLKKNNLRDKVFIASKLPHSSCKSYDDFERIFTEELSRLQTDYIDYYLIHNISSFEQWQRVCDLGIEKWIQEKKDAGQIRQIGFSYHGSYNDFIKVIDSYSWEFVQIQYNYININYQAGQKGLIYANAKGLPVMIMEPLLGGKLAKGLPKEATEIMLKQSTSKTPVAWALNWLWNQPEVTVVLSGMNDMSQLSENLRLADKAEVDMLNENDDRVIQDVIRSFNKNYKVGCTGCNYCMPCPKNINIPACFSSYNNSYVVGYGSGMFMYLNATGMIDENPRCASDCIECGKCEKQCPQGIEIRKELKRVKRRFEIPGFKPIGKFVRKFLR